jgi:hypothetical protein
MAPRTRAGNVDSRKATIAFAHPRDVGNSEAAIQVHYSQNGIHILPVQNTVLTANGRPNSRSKSYVKKKSYSARGAVDSVKIVDKHLACD